MNTVCKEHEWVGYMVTSTGKDTEVGICCKNCGMPKPATDFKVEENLKVH